MLTGYHYVMRHAPTACAHCEQQFRTMNGRVEAWRSSTGRYFCNEFCADDDETAAWKGQESQAQRSLAHISGT